MPNDDNLVPSTETSEGDGGDAEAGFRIKQTKTASSDAQVLTTCAFINRRAAAVTVSVLYTNGGISNGTLYHQNDRWDLHVIDGDCYSWSINGPSVPNCSLKCRPGGVYYVG